MHKQTFPGLKVAPGCSFFVSDTTARKLRFVEAESCALDLFKRNISLELDREHDNLWILEYSPMKPIIELQSKDGFSVLSAISLEKVV